MSELARFTEQFFTSLKAQVAWKGDVLEISKVPESFESWAGKKGPYRLVFHPDHEQADTDLITKGSFLLKSMTSFLEQRGQTSFATLVPLNDPTEAVEKLPLKNTKIAHIAKHATYLPLYQFTFATTLSYLNKKEQNLYHLLVSQGKVFESSLDTFTKQQGRKEEIPEEESRPSYELAKAEVRRRMQPAVTKAATELQEKLTKEQARIAAHYEAHRKELDLTKRKLEHQLQEALKENNFPKIGKVQEQLKQFNHQALTEKLTQEESFLIKDEHQKHALGVDTKLVSTAVFALPTFKLDLFLTGQHITRTLSLSIDPLHPGIPVLTCTSCPAKLYEIWLCTSGHLSCLKCLAGCELCREPVCKSCRIQRCASCNKELCKNCALRCPGCFTTKCSSHFGVDYMTNQKRCSSCLKTCTLCTKQTIPSSMRACDKCTKQYCKPCASASFKAGRCKNCQGAY